MKLPETKDEIARLEAVGWIYLDPRIHGPWHWRDGETYALHTFEDAVALERAMRKEKDGLVQRNDNR